jgi:hypothetical protein
VRHCNENGDPEDDWIKINLILQKDHPTETDITSYIRKQVGTKAFMHWRLCRRDYTESCKGKLEVKKRAVNILAAPFFDSIWISFK